MGWGTFLGKIAEQFQGRTERLKNEQSKLKEERSLLMVRVCNEKISLRISAIDKRLNAINELLKNAA